MKKLEELILDDNGKDDRLKILENGMTKYGCKPYPYPHLSYSSCTASTISLEAFTHLKEYLKNKNLNNKEIYLNEYQNIRDDIRKIIGLKDDVDICLGSSGTDLEMIPYMFIPFGSKVKNIIIAPNEVGSGTLLAADGRVFSNMDNKYHYKKGDKLKDFEKFDIEIINIPIRNDNVEVIDDEKILSQISKSLQDNESYKIIHLVYHSKTGLIKPSPKKLLDLIKPDEKNIIVIDACQFRISREEINNFLDKGCIVFITGSKFFAAPTFSAAALIPSNLRDIAAFRKDTIKGLNVLFSREFFPNRWKSMDDFIYGNNIGLLLRFRAFIFEMQLFNSLAKERIISTIHIFNEVIKDIIKEYKDFEIYSDILDTDDYNKLMSNTILTIGFKDKNIDVDYAKKIYQALISNNWLNNKFTLPIHLGQPVKIKKYNDKYLGTLRIALSSKFFVNYSGKIKNVQKDVMYKEIDYIFKAIIYLLKKDK